MTSWPKVILLIRKLLHIKTFFLSGTTNMQSSIATSLLTFCLLTGALLIDHASWKGASSSDAYAALRLPPTPSILYFCFVFQRLHVYHMFYCLLSGGVNRTCVLWQLNRNKAAMTPALQHLMLRWCMTSQTKTRAQSAVSVPHFLIHHNGSYCTVQNCLQL